MTNEEFISRDDLNVEVLTSAEDATVYVKFTGFDDMDEAEDYAEFLAETLPLLLFGTTRLQ